MLNRSPCLLSGGHRSPPPPPHTPATVDEFLTALKHWAPCWARRAGVRHAWADALTRTLTQIILRVSHVIFYSVNLIYPHDSHTSRLGGGIARSLSLSLSLECLGHSSGGPVSMLLFVHTHWLWRCPSAPTGFFRDWAVTQIAADEHSASSDSGSFQLK